MKRKLLITVLLCMSVLVLTGAQPTHSVRARLTGFQENLPISTAAAGEFTAQISSDDSMITYSLNYSGIEGGTVIGAHIHLGQWWANGNVIAFLCGGGGKPDCTGPSGIVNGTIVASDIIGPAGQGIAPGEFAEALRAMRSSVTYANVHSDSYPGGEIRGQIKPRIGFLYGLF